MTLDQAPDVLTVSEAAKLARVGRNAMYEAIARGEVHGCRIGRSIRIPKAAFTRWLNGEPEERYPGLLAIEGKAAGRTRLVTAADVAPTKKAASPPTKLATIQEVDRVSGASSRRV